MKIGITSDCSSGLEYAPFKHNIKITRTTIHFGETELVDGIDIKADEFYKKLRSTDIVPTTSAPTLGEIAARVEEWKKEGCTDVIHFPISFGLSAYGINLPNAFEDMVEGVNLHVINCHSACIMEGYCAHYAEILANKGYSIEEIKEECQKFADQTVAYFIVDDLKYLVKNGRLNAMSGMIGSLLKIKPILKLWKPGTIDIFEKVRTRNRAIDRIKEVVSEDTKDAKEVIYIVLHSDCENDAKELLEDLKTKYTNGVRYELTTVTPTVGAHIGAGVLAIAYIVLDGLKEKITKGDRIDSIINMEPSDFLIMKNQQEMLTSPELSDYIAKQKRRGFANIKEFEIEYHKRIAMSFASFILTIIGVSLSSRKTKGGMGLHLGIGLGLSFSYILFQTITSTFAVNGNVPPAVAVWIPNILYAGIAFFLYQKAPK